MPGVSFDRAVAFYDETRGYAPGTAERIRAGILAYTGATASSTILEIGVGTGRIALPFIQAGDRFVGVDISRGMLARLGEKAAGAPTPALALGDAMRLPFADASFDVVYAFHVLHLVDDRREVLREVRRVLRPGGVFLSAADGPENGGGETPPRQVRTHWVALLHEMGMYTEQKGPRWITDDVIVADLRQLGARAEPVTLATYERQPLSVRRMADIIEARMFSSDWETPEAIHAEATRQLEEWIGEMFTDPDTLYPLSGDVVAVAGRW